MPRCRAVVVALCLRDIHPSRGLRSVRPAVHACVQVLAGILQVLRVLLPGHAVHPCGRLPLELEESRSQAFDGDMVQEHSEPRVPVFPCYFAHTVQRTARASPALSSGRVLLNRVPLGQLPSLHRLPVANASSARGFRLALGCFQGFPLRARIGLAMTPRPSVRRRVHRLRG